MFAVTNRRSLLAFGALSVAAPIIPLRGAFADDACPTMPDGTAANGGILDRYVAAINALDVGAFPSIFTEDYIQHSGRSPSGLAAQIENVRRIHETWSDIRLQVDDRILGGDKVVARCLYEATHSRTVRGFAPTGRRITFATIDIWRVEGGKFAEHWDLVDIAGMDRQLAGK